MFHSLLNNEDDDIDDGDGGEVWTTAATEKDNGKVYEKVNRLRDSSDQTVLNLETSSLAS